MARDRIVIQRQLRSVPPKCIQDAFPKAENGVPTTAEMVASVWSISASYATPYSAVLGVPTLIGSDTPQLLMLGNLAIKGDNTIIDIFDPSIHGYHNEESRLEGDLQQFDQSDQSDQADIRTDFVCPHCNCKVFLLSVVLYYQEGAVDVFLMEPQLPMSDMFNAFCINGKCRSCGAMSVIAEFDGL